ncbi:TonB-dependent receptor plug domain-containing protein [Nitrospirillum pindoramense]|uniref:Iron complex outermembrane receptor protein n=1 Tax=Nitrospirillum amazonense TaxID=28077 RepID=A0A560GM52_9PROT|nr:TonB-dependent receptor [Nitrospirillum amazonense]TWB34620.1 iron complex outermembrane receptor protein [Nitrospirillum amazonense]
MPSSVSRPSRPLVRLPARLLAGSGLLALAAGFPVTGWSAASDANPAPAAAADDLNEIIVTGTREAGKRVQDSLTSIEVLGGETLQATGQTNLLDALRGTLPSFTADQFGGDVGNLVRSARLRGLSPGQTLVLVNGKRRHNSANIYADGGPNGGSNPADLDFIPLDSIDHIEVLRDGAAAQYGSDAIAGVINIILKKSDSGTHVSTLGGITGRGDGATAQGSVFHGFDLGDGGFINVTADYRHHDFTNRTGDDPRAPSGTVVKGRIYGDPLSDVVNIGYNAEAPLTPSVTFYSFGTASHRSAESYENWRPGSRIPALWPNGFFPEETADEYDVGFTLGARGDNLAGWRWDLSSTYGHDWLAIGVINSGNPNLANAGSGFYNASYAKQTSFNAGKLVSTQQTTNLDLVREFDVGLFAKPVNVAWGLEHRHEVYEVDAGEYASYAAGGSASYAGFTPTDAHTADRNSAAGYIDLSTQLLRNWQFELAGRVEHYDDFGDSESGRVISRYDITPWLAVRGAVGNGFRAPTLAQQYFSALNVSPTSASLQLPVNSPGAKLLGVQALKPETSTEYSAGLVLEPVPGLHATLDFYQIEIQNRIINSGALSGSLAQAAILANGASLPAGISAGNTSVTFYLNGVDTRTQGADLNLDYTTDLASLGAIKWTLAGNYNVTSILKQQPAPKALAGVTILDATAITSLTSYDPRSKISLAANWTLGPWDVTLRETRWGHSYYVAHDYSSVGDYVARAVSPAFLTDLNIGYRVTQGFRVDLGAQNLFDRYPAKTNPATRWFGINVDTYPQNTPYGFNGGYYYVKLSADF